jgi:hypothetical protein
MADFSQPIARRGYGRLSFIISRNSALFGRVYKDLNPDFAKEFESNDAILEYEMFLKAGSILKPTVDCFGWTGIVKIFHEELEKVVATYERIRAMEELETYATEDA